MSEITVINRDTFLQLKELAEKRQPVLDKWAWLDKAEDALEHAQGALFNKVLEMY